MTQKLKKSELVMNRALRESEKITNRHMMVNKIMMLTTPVWDGKKKKLKPKMTMAEACSVVGITQRSLSSWMKEDNNLAVLVEEFKNSHRQMMNDMAESIVIEGLSGGIKLRGNEKINLAMRFLEKTDKYYNPIQNVKVDAESKIIQMSEEEIVQRIKELSESTNTEIDFNKLTESKDVDYTITDNYESDEQLEEEAGETQVRE